MKHIHCPDCGTNITIKDPPGRVPECQMYCIVCGTEFSQEVDTQEALVVRCLKCRMNNNLLNVPGFNMVIWKLGRR